MCVDSVGVEHGPRRHGRNRIESATLAVGDSAGGDDEDRCDVGCSSEQLAASEFGHEFKNQTIRLLFVANRDRGDLVVRLPVGDRPVDRRLISAAAGIGSGLADSRFSTGTAVLTRAAVQIVGAGPRMTSYPDVPPSH